MSFDFTAAGTKAETLASLKALDFTAAYADQLGAAIRDVLAKTVEDSAGHLYGAPDRPVRYEIRAYGHAAAGGADPSLTVTLVTRPAGVPPPA